MRIVRYINPSWHHYAVQYPNFNIVRDWKSYENASGDKKFSYISEFNPTSERIPILVEEIKKHLTVADHVYVNMGEPGLSYKDIKKSKEGPYLGTVDFINDHFVSTDAVTFFGNAILQKPTSRPWHYFNDMFFSDINLYNKDKLCLSLLQQLDQPLSNRTYHWEIMCSRHTDIYKKLKQHPVDQNTLSTCHSLGIQFYGSSVVQPKNNNPAEGAGLENTHIRCSDLIDPEIYNSSYYSAVIETIAPADNSFSMFSEKEAKPIVGGRPFIIIGSQYHMRAFRSLGFKSFSPMIDESYDLEPDRNKRLKMIFDEMHRLSQSNPVEVYRELKPVLEHNKKWFENKSNWNKEFLDAWHQNQSII